MTETDESAVVDPDDIPPPPGAPDETEPAKKPANWVRRIAIVALLSWTVAAFAAGMYVGLGQRITPPAPDADIAIEIEQIEIPDAPAEDDDAPAAAVTPNVLGLNPADAQAALTDAGVVDGITLVETAVAGPSGFVLSQDPAAGSPIDGAATLSISAPASVPDLVGAQFSDASTQIEDLGAQVRVSSRYVKGVPADQVLSIEPAQGDLPLEVDVVIAAAPAQLNLGELDPLENDCSTDSGFGVNGDLQEESTRVCQLARSDQQRSISWDLSADVDTVAFTAGVTDEGDLNASASIIVLVDGAAVDTQTTSFGQPVTITVETADALRLEIIIRTEVPDEVFQEWDRSVVALFDIVATGGAAALDELAGLDS